MHIGPSKYSDAIGARVKRLRSCFVTSHFLADKYALHQQTLIVFVCERVGDGVMGLWGCEGTCCKDMENNDTEDLKVRSILLYLAGILKVVKFTAHLYRDHWSMF